MNDERQLVASVHWQDCTDYDAGEGPKASRAWELEIGTFVVRVERQSDDGRWFGSCMKLGVAGVALSYGLTAAQRGTLDYIVALLKWWHESFEAARTAS